MEMLIFISFFIFGNSLIALEIYKEYLKYNAFNNNRMTFSEFIEYYYFPNLTKLFNKEKSYYEIQKIENKKINLVTRFQISIFILLILLAVLGSIYLKD